MDFLKHFLSTISIYNQRRDVIRTEIDRNRDENLT